MSDLLETVVFICGIYWPYMAVAAAIGLVTGWLSLSRRPGEGAP